jgi:ribonuclease III
MDELPYNVKNTLITDTDIKLLFSKFNITVNVNNINIYIQGLTHKSYTRAEIDPELILIKPDNCIDLFDKSNERLEFLGDSVIKLIVAEYLFRRYPDQNEGFMTKLKTKIENKDSLAKFAKRLGLDQYIIISKQIEENFGRNSNKLLEDCFESFIAALYIDIGFDICKKFLLIILETEIDYADLLYKDTNFKDQLLKFYHSNKWSHPKYKELNTEGPIHKKIFTIGVEDQNGDIIKDCISKHNSKKTAEQLCAMKILRKFNKISDDQLVFSDYSTEFNTDS